jgi:peptide/nickel transport system ATP-binding protein
MKRQETSAVPGRSETLTGPPPLVELVDLRVAFPAQGRSVMVVDGVSLTVAPGECIGIVGESGSGKTMTALASMRLVPPPGRIVSGQVLYRGRNLLEMSEEEVREMRGVVSGMVPQNPMSALNPVLRVGYQIEEAMAVHDRFRGAEARQRVPALMSRVGIAGARQRQHDFPHQFSGGMRQRVCIAMALANEPALIVADEPTTGLDVTVQAQILEELTHLRSQSGAGIIVITHDMNVVARMADRLVVMYAGQVVESGPTTAILSAPEHPYTWSLLRSAPSLHTQRGERLRSIEGMPPVMSDLPRGCRFHPRCPLAVSQCLTEEPALAAVSDRRDARCFVLMSNVSTAIDAPVVRVRNRQEAPTPQLETAPLPIVEALRLTKTYKMRSSTGAAQRLTAVAGVDMQIWPGETLGLVGESGSGKSTLGRLLVGLEAATAGSARFEGLDLTRLRGRRRRRVQQRMHLIFQDPYSSLDPRMRIATSIAEPVTRFATRQSAQVREEVADVMRACGLSQVDSRRYPHELSGGQLQRASIARALVSRPSFIVADEPVASLDVSIQAQIINLLLDLQEARELTYLVISHDLAVVRSLADRVAVMYLGQIAEIASNDQIYSHPRHPYTMMLLAAHTATGRFGAASERAEVPSAAVPPSGCRFHTRCRWARPECAVNEPKLRELEDGQWVACHFAEALESTAEGNDHAIADNGAALG